MELATLSKQGDRGAEIRRRLQRQENVDNWDEESVAGNETVSRPSSAKSIASHGASYTGSAHSAGFIPVNGNTETKFWICGSDRSFWSLTKTVLYLVFFGVLNIFAFSSYFFDTKYNLIRFLYEQCLDCCIDFGTDGMMLVVGIAFLWFVFNDTAFSELLSYVQGLQTGRSGKDQLTSPLCVKITTACLLASSILGAMIYTADCGGGIEGLQTWTFKEWLLDLHAGWFAMGMLMWTPSAFSTKDNWKKKFIIFTPRNLAFGAVNAVLTFCGTLHHFIIQDLILSNNITFFLHARDMAKTCEPMAKTIEEAQCQTRAILRTKGHRKRYNKAFGTLIRVVIVQELFLFTFLLCELIENDPYALINAAYCIVALKGIIFYALASKIHDYGQASLLCSKNLKANFGESIVVDGEVVSMTVLINELESEPIGVGKDGFLINEPFVFGIVSSVFGLFGLQATARGKL